MRVEGKRQKDKSGGERKREEGERNKEREEEGVPLEQYLSFTV